MSEDGSSVTIAQIYEEIIKNRKELRNAIEASETRVLLKIENLNNKVTKLERENQELKDKIEQLEIRSKKNNIVVFGLDTFPENIQPVEAICGELKKLLNIEISEGDINNVYSLGKTTDSPIKVEFTTYLKKIQILQNCKKLKGTQVGIAHDLTFKQREDHKTLKLYLDKVKANPANKCYIKGNKLCINNNFYSIEELKESGEYIFKYPNSNSAPSTPSHRIIHRETPEVYEQEEQKQDKQYKTIEKEKPTENVEHRQDTLTADANKGKTKTTVSVIQSKVKTRSTNK